MSSWAAAPATHNIGHEDNENTWRQVTTLLQGSCHTNKVPVILTWYLQGFFAPKTVMNRERARSD